MKISDYLKMTLLASGMNNDTLNFSIEILLFCIFHCSLILFLLQIYQLYNRELLDAPSGLGAVFLETLASYKGLGNLYCIPIRVTDLKEICV